MFLNKSTKQEHQHNGLEEVYVQYIQYIYMYIYIEREYIFAVYIPYIYNIYVAEIYVKI